MELRSMLEESLTFTRTLAEGRTSIPPLLVIRRPNRSLLSWNVRV